ncbi:uncharacterized protein EI90DRAFT_3034412 [Cantharellus anzutake]|uniref:uncharacterized protein n=1 Tax=Cantharellus anzutake TaxID=1750568 RepID=UPI0019055AB5|nr:uncharacterized protein EI90DRAFT_3034412 [Cantharellus anzutake]KAF8341557.1 hypothetical protein EI90DRAFT_3034412 [Cantharellus anzutake]
MTSTAPRPRGPYQRDVCAECRKGRIRCSPRDPRTGKCKNCAHLLLIHDQSTNSSSRALDLVPVLRDIVKDVLHDIELDKSIEWAVEFFEARAARLGPFRSDPVRLCHWALILRQPRIQQIMGEENVEELASAAFGIWFVEAKTPTVWTLQATIILLDHFKMAGDSRMLAQQMMGDPSCFDPSDSQGHTIEKLSSILRLRFPSTDSRLVSTMGQGTSDSVLRTAQSNVTERSAPPRMLLHHPVDVYPNVQLTTQDDGFDAPPDKPPDQLPSNGTMLDPASHLRSLSPLNSWPRSYDDAANIFGSRPLFLLDQNTVDSISHGQATSNSPVRNLQWPFDV